MTIYYNVYSSKNVKRVALKDIESLHGDIMPDGTLRLNLVFFDDSHVTVYLANWQSFSMDNNDVL